MTHRLNSKDLHSRDRVELNGTSTIYESSAGIDYSACIEPGAYRRQERLQGCFDQRKPVVGNIELDQQFYRHGILPHLQISLENDYAISTTSGAEAYAIASFLDGSANRQDGKRNLQIGNHVRGFYEQRPLPHAFYTGSDIEVNKFHSKPHHSAPAIHEIEPNKHRSMPADHANDDCQQSMKPSDNEVTVPVPNVPDAQLTISGAPTITPEKINEVLKEYNSPAAGMGQYIYDEGIKHGINPAMALAFYVVESSCGTSGLAVKNKSWGNMRGHGPHGYRPYNSIQESLDDWYRLMGDVYPHKFHADKLKSVIALYSPNSDGNNEASYVRSVGQMVRKWNTEK